MVLNWAARLHNSVEPLSRNLACQGTAGYSPTAAMQQEAHPSSLPYLCQRFQHLVWSCLDSDLTKTAVFHAERYFAMDQRNHDARHLYAMALFREGQTYSALCLVNVAPDIQCVGCLEIKAKCCSALGRHRQAREALEEITKRKDYVPSGMLFVFWLPPPANVTLRRLSRPTKRKTFPRRSCTSMPLGNYGTEGQCSRTSNVQFPPSVSP